MTEAEVAKNILLEETCSTCIRLETYENERHCTIHDFFSGWHEKEKNNYCCWYDNEETLRQRQERIERKRNSQEFIIR